MNSYISHLFTCADNVSYYKSVHQPIPTPENREHHGNFQSESVSFAFNEFCHFTLQNEIAIFQILQQLQCHQT